MKLAFYKAEHGNKLDTWLSWVTWGPYSHVEILFSDGMWCSSSPRDSGVRYKTIDPLDHWDYRALDVTHKQEQIVRDWCDTKIGLSYDWWGVYSFLIPFIPQKDNEWFCSEFCVVALQEIGIWPDINPSKSTPNRMWEYPL